ncbi:hypothetical protein Neosp_009156 [[Neocosmospora] mangrovei]
MVRLLNIAAILFAGFVTVQGCTHCQCLYNDGSHCCVQEPGPSCNGGGKNTCVSTWNAHGRKKCYGYPS